MTTEARQPATATTFDINSVTAGYNGKPVLVDASLRIEEGDMLALCGPNGSGKSTLLRVMARLLRPRHGRVLLHGQTLDELSRRALARKLAMMPQNPTSPPGVTVREMIAYGRSPHTTWLKPFSRDDRTIIDQAIGLCDLHPLADRQVDTLSGGERQRAWLAMAVAQQPDTLLLDEPVSALDIGHQLDVLQLLAHLNREQGTTIVVVLHDINLAARYCRSLAMLRDHRIIAAGPMGSTLSDELLGRTFGVRAAVHHVPGIHYPICTFDRPPRSG